ncbi:MAG: galactose mutarotase [Bacteroidales bacterium]|nr:galactose mutarotase [Bacteroidales bacterium]MCF8389829.1 galactose mutarotase [Bacteroidales bacterium]
MRKILILSLIALSLLMIQCGTSTSKKEKFPGRLLAENRVPAESFIKDINGNTSQIYRLENSNGMVVRLTNIGASIVQVIVPDKNGKFDDITLGFADIDTYVKNPMYSGCVVGRFGNRIAKGKFQLNGKTFQLGINNGENSLHGGPDGFHLRFWDGEEIENGVRFSYTSVDMEEGYPGELFAQVTYRLNDANEISIEYQAEAQDSTFVNLTNHSYWNLNGEANGDILSHKMMLNAEFITPVNEGLIPTGELMSVEGTPFDFRDFHSIGERIDDEHQQIIYGGGYDHNFVLSMEDSKTLKLAAIVYSEESGIELTIRTTEPGIQFYSGNFMNGKLKGKNGNDYNYRYAIVLETQHFPDSPNQVNFPSTLLIPGELYNSVSVYKFGIRE